MRHFLISHCPKLKMNGKKPSEWQFFFPGLMEAVLKVKKHFFSLTWTLEIIQFIRVEMHMYRPDKSNFFCLGYDINYTSIWPFVHHPCFSTGKVSNVAFFLFRLQLFSTMQGLNNSNWKKSSIQRLLWQSMETQPGFVVIFSCLSNLALIIFLINHGRFIEIDPL